MNACAPVFFDKDNVKTISYVKAISGPSSGYRLGGVVEKLDSPSYFERNSTSKMVAAIKRTTLIG